MPSAAFPGGETESGIGRHRRARWYGKSASAWLPARHGRCSIGRQAALDPERQHTRAYIFKKECLNHPGSGAPPTVIACIQSKLQCPRTRACFAECVGSFPRRDAAQGTSCGISATISEMPRKATNLYLDSFSYVFIDARVSSAAQIAAPQFNHTSAAGRRNCMP